MMKSCTEWRDRKFNDRIKDHRKRGAWGWSFFRLTEGHCAYCGKELDFDGMWHIEHVVPRSRGGAHQGNRVAACESCNYSKGPSLNEEWRALIPQRLKKDLQRGISRFERFLPLLPAGDAACIERHIAEVFDILESTRARFYIDNLEERQND